VLRGACRTGRTEAGYRKPIHPFRVTVAVPLPPFKDVLDQLQHAVLPGAGGAALVMCLFLLLGRWAGAGGSAAAVAFGFMWGNFTLAQLAGTESPTWANTARLIPWAPDADAPGYKWLARAGMYLVLVGLASRWLGLLAARALPERVWLLANVVVWVPRVAAVIVVSAWLALGKAAEAEQWANLRWHLAGAMLVVWVALDGVARNGASAQVSGYASAALMTAGAILLYTHNARFMEIAVVLGSALFGVSVANGLLKPDADGRKADASGAMPAVVAFLPGLILGTRPSMDAHNVPAACFWLVALAPAALLPFLLPPVARKAGWWVPAVRAALVLAPLVAAVAVAARHETLVFEEQW
jgi:hypothetical protein